MMNDLDPNTSQIFRDINDCIRREFDSYIGLRNTPETQLRLKAAISEFMYNNIPRAFGVQPLNLDIDVSDFGNVHISYTPSTIPDGFHLETYKKFDGRKATKIVQNRTEN